jgi:hypothetical protein
MNTINIPWESLVKGLECIAMAQPDLFLDRDKLGGPGAFSPKDFFYPQRL